MIHSLTRHLPAFRGSGLDRTSRSLMGRTGHRTRCRQRRCLPDLQWRLLVSVSRGFTPSSSTATVRVEAQCALDPLFQRRCVRTL
jgi:hypothetical protein